MIDFGSVGDERSNLLHEIGAHLRVARIVGERAHEAGQVDANRPHPDDALIEAVRLHLPLVPIDEDRIDGHEAEPAAHAQRRKQIGLAQANHGNVQRAANFQKARLLEMADDECIVARALRLERVADRLRGAAKFRQRMEVMVGRIEAMDFEPDAGTGGRVQQRLQPLDVGRLLGRMDEALIPDAGGTGGFGHALPPRCKKRGQCHDAFSSGQLGTKTGCAQSQRLRDTADHGTWMTFSSRT